MTKLSTMLSLGETVIDGVTGVIGRALYDTFGHIIILLLDWLQDIFRGLAGLEGMKINGQPVNGGEEKYDLVFWLVQTDIIQDIFWSMILFSAFLLIIMTVLALVKNTYEEKQKPVWDIISLSFKGLFGFILVPAMIIVGLAFSNILLQAIDSGTSFGNSTKMSTTLFMSSAYDANKVRIAVNEQSTGECREAFVYIVEKTNLLDVDTSLQSAYNSLGTLTLEDYDEIATKIDNAFTSGKMKGPRGYMDAQSSWDVIIIYNMWKMNYLILIAGGCVLIGLFFKMCWGMVGRIFKVCFDFVLIPVACAMTPFDSGKANKSIQSDMVKNVTMAYGTVGALNLYFSILPIVNTIEFNNGGLQSTGMMTAIFQLMISIVGLFSCNAIIKTVNGWFGTGDVLAEGDSTFKAFQGGMKSMRSGFGVGEKFKKANKFVGNKLGAYKGGALAAEKAGKSKFGQFKGGLKGMFGTTAAAKYMDEASISKNAIAGKKAGTDYWNEKNATKGTMMDMFSRENIRTDRRKAELDMIKNLKAFDKSSAGMNDKQRANALYELGDIKAILENGGWTIDGVGSTEYLNATAGLQKSLKKDHAGSESLGAFMSAKEKQRVAYATALNSLGLSDNEIKNFLKGDTSVVAGKSQEQIDALNAVLNAKNEAEEKAKSAAIFLTKKQQLNAKEEDLMRMSDEDVSKKLESEFGLGMNRSNSNSKLDNIARTIERKINIDEVHLKAREDKQKEEAGEIEKLLNKYMDGKIGKKDPEMDKIKNMLEARAKMK